MNYLDFKTSKDIEKGIAKRIAHIRRRRKISQKDLAAISGVSYGSLRRFEQTGEISLNSLIKIAMALKLDRELDDLFEDADYLSIEEIINEQS